MSEQHHDHHHLKAASPEEAKALLAYMVDHNRHHAEELNDLSESLPEDVRQMVLEAAAMLSSGTNKLQRALDKLEG